MTCQHHVIQMFPGDPHLAHFQADADGAHHVPQQQHDRPALGRRQGDEDLNKCAKQTWLLKEKK